MEKAIAYGCLTACGCNPRHRRVNLRLAGIDVIKKKCRNVHRASPGPAWGRYESISFRKEIDSVSTKWLTPGRARYSRHPRRGVRTDGAQAGTRGSENGEAVGYARPPLEGRPDRIRVPHGLGLVDKAHLRDIIMKMWHAYFLRRSRRK
jgi:hypothetical protein